MQLHFFDDDDDKYHMLRGKQPEEEDNSRGCEKTKPQVFSVSLFGSVGSG